MSGRRVAALAAGILYLACTLPVMAQDPRDGAIVGYLPLAGTDGYLGLEMKAAIELAASEAGLAPGVRIVDLSGGGVSNPHQDEGQGNFPDVDGARAAGLGPQPGAAAALVGPRSNVAAALCSGMHGWNVPAIAIVPRLGPHGACAQLVVGDQPPAHSPEYETFVKRFHAATGAPPMLEATAAYVATRIALDALARHLSGTALCTTTFRTVQGPVRLAC